MYVTLDLACEVRLERGGGQVHFCIPTREPRTEQEGVPGVWLHRHRSPHPVLPTPSDTCSHMQLSGVPPPSPWLGSMAFSTTPAFSHPQRHADTAGESPVSRLLTTSDPRHQNPRHLPMLLPITDAHIPAQTSARSPKGRVLGGGIRLLPPLSFGVWRKSPPASPPPQAPRGGQPKALGPPLPWPPTLTIARWQQGWPGGPASPTLFNRLLGTIVPILGTNWLPLPPPEVACGTLGCQEGT